MHVWSALGIFLLGTGAGAITTAAYYSAQIRELKRLIDSLSARNTQEKEAVQREADEKRKSA